LVRRDLLPGHRGTAAGPLHPMRVTALRVKYRKVFHSCPRIFYKWFNRRHNHKEKSCRRIQPRRCSTRACACSRRCRARHVGNARKLRRPRGVEL
jgi:hypothetical protein